MEIFIPSVPEDLIPRKLEAILLRAWGTLSSDKIHLHVFKGKDAKGRSFAVVTTPTAHVGRALINLAQSHAIKHKDRWLVLRESNKSPKISVVNSLIEASKISGETGLHGIDVGEAREVTGAISYVSFGLWCSVPPHKSDDDGIHFNAVFSEEYEVPTTHFHGETMLTFLGSKLIVQMNNGRLFHIHQSQVLSIQYDRDPSNSVVHLFFSLFYPPLFAAMPSHDSNYCHESDDSGDDDLKEMTRIFLKLTTAPGHVGGMERRGYLDSSHKSLAQWLNVCRIDVASCQAENIITMLRQHGFPEIQRSSIGWAALDSDPEVSLVPINWRVSFEAAIKKLPLNIAFQLESLVTNYAVYPAEIIKLIPVVAATVWIAQHAHTTIARALQDLFFYSEEWDAFSGTARPDFCSLFKELLTNKRWLFGVAMTDSHLDTQSSCRLHAVAVTPSGISVSGPSVDQTNRVLRRFGQVADRFLRVTFGDEDGSMVTFHQDIDQSPVYRSFLTALRDGITVAGRHFKFLAFSSSSLREGSVLFFSQDGQMSGDWCVDPHVKVTYEKNQDQQQQRYEPEGEPCQEDVTVESIRAWMGDFSKIRCPARYAARMAQAFTSTTATISIQPDELDMHVPDVERNNFCFSNGCGTISFALAQEMWSSMTRRDTESLLLPSDRPMAHAFQIRFGGAKGMISVDTSTLGTDVRRLRIRNSMIKFDAPNARCIEVAAHSEKCRDGYLNRQIIVLLEDLGVPKDVFLAVQRDAVERVSRLWSSRKTAEDLVTEGLLSGLVRRVLDKIPFAVWSRISFVKACFDHLAHRALADIKYRARIPIPGAFTLLGIMDETGELQEGEICVPVRLGGGHDEENDVTFLTGPVLVFRSPCLHPGDARVVRAVTINRLKHLANCVIFSPRGVSDLPSALAGGDLDGDLYTVVNRPELHPRETFPRASYTREKPIDLDRPVSMADISEFVVNFLENNKLGIIANRHLALSDQVAQGSKNAKCVLLAEMHSTAVDFPKTGIKVDMRGAPRVDIRPDFMNRFGARKGFYKSDRALGHMFRDATLAQSLAQPLATPQTSDGNNGTLSAGGGSGGGGGDPLWEYLKSQVKTWQTRLADAHYYHDYFDSGVRNVQSASRPRLTEVELFTGASSHDVCSSRAANRIQQVARGQFEHVCKDVIAYMEAEEWATVKLAWSGQTRTLNKENQDQYEDNEEEQAEGEKGKAECKKAEVNNSSLGRDLGEDDVEMQRKMVRQRMMDLAVAGYYVSNVLPLVHKKRGHSFGFVLLNHVFGKAEDQFKKEVWIF